MQRNTILLSLLAIFQYLIIFGLEKNRRKVGTRRMFLTLKSNVRFHSCTRSFVCAVQHEMTTEKHFLVLLLAKCLKSPWPAWSNKCAVTSCHSETQRLIILSMCPPKNELSSVSWQDVCCNNSPEYFGTRCVCTAVVLLRDWGVVCWMTQ